MKLKLSWFLLPLLTVGMYFVSCSDDDDDESISSFSVDRDEVTIGAEGGVEKIVISSPAEWVASSSEPWVMISPANGKGLTECEIVIDSTLVNSVRTATITFTPEGWQAQKVTISQTGFGKMIAIEEPAVEIEYSAAKDERYMEAKVTTNVPFKIEIEYEGNTSGWLTPTETEVKLDRGARPRTADIRLDWSMNTAPAQRVAKVHLLPVNEGDELESPATLTVTQKAAPLIEDNRAGDSLALLIIRERLNMMSAAWDPSENLRNWNGITLWEATDEDMPEGALGRVKEVELAMFRTEESIPQEIRYLTYLESLYIGSNTNTMLLNIDLGPEICTLNHLKELELFAYGLVSLPEEFKNLGKSLERLNLAANNFATIPSVLTKENFPKLKSLNLIANRRWTTSDLRKAGNYEDGLGLHFHTADNDALRRLFLWDTLEELRLSNNYIEGEIPDFEVGVDGVEAYTQADVDAFGGDTIQYVADHSIPKILPNMKFLTLNLNFFTGRIPDWILYHPYFLEWVPELLLFNQQENGKNSAGTNVRFDNAPANFEYYYQAFPLYRDKYELKEEYEE